MTFALECHSAAKSACHNVSYFLIQEVRPHPFRSPQHGIGGQEADLLRVLGREEFLIFCQAATK